MIADDSVWPMTWPSDIHVSSYHDMFSNLSEEQIKHLIRCSSNESSWSPRKVPVDQTTSDDATSIQPIDSISAAAWSKYFRYDLEDYLETIEFH